MITVDSAFICSAIAPEANGLLSILGAFGDSVNALELPMNYQTVYLARVAWDPKSEPPAQHTLTVRLEFDADGERLAALNAGFLTASAPGTDPDLPSGAMVALPFAVSLRREGMYHFVLSIDGDDVHSVPFKVRRQLPAV